MIESFYNTFGFIGALGISVLSFILILFWVAGVAGIASIHEDRYKNWKLVAAVFLPVYPVIWLCVDMLKQHSEMSKEVEL